MCGGCWLAVGRDVIAQAQSGTGKTATFAISILQAVDMNKKSCQALVLAPTRELAQQIQKVCVWVVCADVTAACVGGDSVGGLHGRPMPCLYRWYQCED